MAGRARLARHGLGICAALLAWAPARAQQPPPATVSAAPAGAPLNQTRYFVRRARLHLDVDHGRMAGSLELDANTVNGASAGVIDAEVSVRARARDDSGRPWGEATIGL